VTVWSGTGVVVLVSTRVVVVLPAGVVVVTCTLVDDVGEGTMVVVVVVTTCAAQAPRSTTAAAIGRIRVRLSTEAGYKWQTRPMSLSSVDEYLDQSPEPQRSTLIELRGTLREILPQATEDISYAMPAFRVNGKAIAGYAHAKSHCSYYPHSGSVLQELDEEELRGYQWSKGTLWFPVDRSLPPSLVKRLVDERMSQLGF
jgi:uncharacterized protein YdhG (YjbR/CyaY superfamily)